MTPPKQHDELRELPELYVLGALAPEERASFEAHLTTCAACAAEVQALSPVAGALAQMVPQIDPPPALRARVLNSLAGFDSLVASDFSRTTVSATTESPTPRFKDESAAKVQLKLDATNDTRDAREGDGHATLPWLAAAAALAIAAGLGIYTSQLRADLRSLEGRLREAMARADASERQVADARRAADEAQSRVAVLSAPDLMRIDLAGQPVAPDASARAYWSRSRGLVFTATDLPALPTGRVYQLWVLSAQPAPIGAGLLRPDATGRINAMIETPLDLPKPTAIAVTIEPDGGVPAPTGEKYLIGLAPAH